MASELGVQTIQHTNGTDAITIGSTGIISQPNLPVFRVDKTADQTSIADNTETVVTFDEVTFDPESVWDTTNNRLTVNANTAGYWWFNCTLYTDTNTHAETAQIYFRKNGTREIQFFGCGRSSGGSSGPASDQPIFNGSGILDLTSAGDYFDITIVVDASSGGTTRIDQNNSYNRTFVQGYRLR
jgi:hypothetical protein